MELGIGIGAGMELGMELGMEQEWSSGVPCFRPRDNGKKSHFS